MMIGPTLRRVYSRTPVAHDETYRARRAEVLIDRAPPRAAADIVVQRIEDTPCLLPTHERDDRPPVGPIPPTPATKRVGVGGKTDPAGGIIASLGDHRRPASAASKPLPVIIASRRGLEGCRRGAASGR